MVWQDFYKNKKILILGGAGFIGSNLAERLVQLGAEVTIIDGFVEHTGGDERNVENFSEKIELVKSKIENVSNLDEYIAKAGVIINCMAITSHKLGMENPLLDIDLNLLSHMHLINALKENPKKVIYLGSIYQYGNCNGIVKEDHPQIPFDTQGINKNAAENFFRVYSKKYNFDVISLRIVNCFGENQKVEGEIGLLGSFVKDIIEGNQVEVYGDKDRKKNIIYVKDLVELVLRLIPVSGDGFNAYNVCGEDVHLGLFLDNTISVVGNGDYVTKDFPQEVKNIKKAVFSNEKLSNKIGYFQMTDLKTSVANTIAYFKSRIGRRE